MVSAISSPGRIVKKVIYQSGLR